MSIADALAGAVSGAAALEAGFWAHLAAGAESSDALGRRLRQARRADAGGADQGESALELVRELLSLDWPINAMWILGEDSQLDPRVRRALEVAVQAGKLREPARRALGLRIQIWLGPRARYATRKLTEGIWQALCERASALAPGPASDALWIRVLAREACGDGRHLVLPPQALPRVEALSAERVARLDRVSRFLLAFLASVRQVSETPWSERRRGLDELRALFPPPRRVAARLGMTRLGPPRPIPYWSRTSSRRIAASRSAGMIPLLGAEAWRGSASCSPS